MKTIDYRVPYALSLLLHVAVLGLLGLRMPNGDESTTTVTQNAFHVQLLADRSREPDDALAMDRPAPESIDAVAAPVAGAVPPVESVAEAVAEPVAERALERAELIDTPPEEVSVARIVAKATVPDLHITADAPPARRVIAATLHTDFLDYGEPATASRNAEQASLSKPTERAGARALRLVKPVYPMSARRLGHEGTVVLAIRVLDSGYVGDVTIVTSTGHRSLDQAAVRAAWRSRYAPAIFGGLSVSSTQHTAFTFRLEDAE